MESAIIIVIIGVAAIIAIVYYVGTLALNIINCYRERDHLREQLNAKRELYNRNGQRTIDAMEKIDYLNGRITSLEWSLQCEQDFSASLIQTHQEELAEKDKIIAILNKQLERNKNRKEVKNND